MRKGWCTLWGVGGEGGVERGEEKVEVVWADACSSRLWAQRLSTYILQPTPRSTRKVLMVWHCNNSAHIKPNKTNCVNAIPPHLDV